MFSIIKLIPDDLIDDLLVYGDTSRQYKVGVMNNGEKTYNPSLRSTTGIRINPKLFTEVNELLETYIDDDSVVNQFDFLIYHKGDFYRRHVDTFSEPHLKDARVWTTITMLERSEDLEGGGLIVGDSDPIHLKNGETIIFKSNLEHEALEVLQGTRKVLVAWLGMYKYD